MNEHEHEPPPPPTVRFAPSPTGHLHIGGVRTALFNYLYAKNKGGEVVLRIEDTDLSRSDPEMAEEIIKGLQWLGIHWDRGPFYQSRRFDRYQQMARGLLEENMAYRCFCTPEEIDSRRKDSEKEGKDRQIYKYDRHCLKLTPGEIQQKLDRETPFVIRFRVPEGVTRFKDRLHKEMKIDNSQLEDFVLLKSDHSPTYHLSVVVDDTEMLISDVIRGDDHISNTFKQILLFKTLLVEPPRYTHLPLILGPDRKKLSKRHGRTSVLEFKRAGYLPEAVITYLSQLSWIPADSKKIFTMDELIKQFNLSKLSKNSPVFDYDKLKFLNGLAIRQRDPADILRLLTEGLDDSGGSDFAARYGADEGRALALIRLVAPRMKTLEDFLPKFAGYMGGDLDYGNPDRDTLTQKYTVPQIPDHLKLLPPLLEDIDDGDFTADTIEGALRECAEQRGIKAGDLIHPARFALTAEAVSPSIFEVFVFLGKTESIKRINNCIDYFGSAELAGPPDNDQDNDQNKG